MKDRFLRALYKGGCVAAISEKVWGVWRSHDLRSREIGRVTNDDVQVLRLNGHLKMLGHEAPQRLIWSGPTLALCHVAPSAEAALEPVVADMRGAALLERIVISIEDKRLQEQLLSAAMAYAADIEAAMLPATSAGMNWAAIAAGTRIDGGRSGGTDEGQVASIQASRRIDALRQALSPQTRLVLQALIIDRVSRTAFGRRFAVGDKAGEAKALAALRRLDEAYDNEVRRPERAGTQFA
jgi:hypothetical protein